MEFIGRTRELQTLKTFTTSPNAGLMILFGHRRIGKTRLLIHFIEQHPEIPAFYWMATTHNETYQLRDFSQAILHFDPRMSVVPSADFSFGSWEDALQHLAGIVTTLQQPVLLILDEFTYLLRNQPAISSLFQRIWDHHLSKIPTLKLILTGSLIGMMAREVFAYQAPLYGRATAQIRLRPLPFAALSQLFGERSAEERVAIYAITGGVPAYLELFTRTDRFTTALREHCLLSGSIFLSDPPLIVYEQLSEPQTYESVLSAIAAGCHRWSDIAKIAGVKESAIGHYLKVLQELEFVERREPILTKGTSKKGRYFVRDPFLRFYYRFIVPQLGALARGYQTAVTDKIMAELRPFIGLHTFEELCREWVWAAAMANELPFVPEAVGSYWRRYRGQGVQLDVVAAAPRQKQLLIGEAKWGRQTLSRSILSDLIKRSQRMPQVAQGWQTTYILFARVGFSKALKEAAVEHKTRLVSLTELERTLQTLA